MKRISTFLVAMLCAVAAIFAGDLYYFAANTKQADGSYVDRYLYVNASGALATTPECVVGDDHYQWQLVPNGTDAYYLKNAAGKYLSYGPRLTLSDSPYSFQLKDDAVHAASGAKSLYNPTSSGGKYMVLKADGTAFDQYSVPVNNGSWCSDYILTSVSDVVGYTLNVVSNIAAADAYIRSKRCGAVYHVLCGRHCGDACIRIFQQGLASVCYGSHRVCSHGIDMDILPIGRWSGWLE